MMIHVLSRTWVAGVRSHCPNARQLVGFSEAKLVQNDALGKVGGHGVVGLGGPEDTRNIEETTLPT